MACLFVGCSRTRPQPDLHQLGPGIAESYKRYERHPQRDFFFHWTRRAYAGSEQSWSLPARNRGGDQERIVEQWGKPDYVRKKFKSLEGDKIEEWVYLDRAVVFQFHRGRLIYEGPMTDYERILIERGYPDRDLLSTSESGNFHRTMEYRSLFLSSRFEVFHLSNGWIIHSTEGD